MAIEFARRLASTLGLRVVNSRHAVVIGVPVGTTGVLHGDGCVTPRFFHQPKARKNTRKTVNLSNFQLIGIGVDFADFSELGKKHLYLPSFLWPPHKR